MAKEAFTIWVYLHSLKKSGWNTPDQSDVEGSDLEESVHGCYQGSIKEGI